MNRGIEDAQRHAERMQEIQPFRVMEVMARAAELEAAGQSVVHFEVGEPDFVSAEPIVQAGIKALEEGRTKYTQATGLPALRAAIADYYATLGVVVDPERVIVTTGASGGLSMLTTLLLNPGESILITDPGYPCNEVFVRQVGGHPVRVATAASNEFQPTASDLAAAWQDTTRGVLLASPANPTGTMLPLDTVAQVARLCTSRGGFFVLDEIYQGITADAPYATGLEIVDDLFVLNSFSKYFGMTGWRLGWVVVPDRSVDDMAKLAQNLFICPPAPAQYAALAAFSDAAMATHRARAEIFGQRRDLLLAGLQSLGFVVPVVPTGAFYLYVDISHLGLSSDEFCTKLLNEYHVAVTPGHDFGEHDCDRYVRFAYTTSEQEIVEGLDRIGKATAAWAA